VLQVFYFFEDEEKRMKTKKTIITVLTAALLISAVLIIGCINPIDEMSSGQYEKGNTNAPPPAGKGVIRISLSDNARTILPASIPAKESMFYTVVFTGTVGTNNKTVSLSTYSDLIGDPILLNADTYTVVITAYKEAAGTNSIAGCTKTGVSVASGSSSSIDAVLTAFGGSGTFTYNITVPALPSGWLVTSVPSSYTVSKLEVFDSSDAIVDLDGAGTNDYATLTISGPNTDSISLPSGYYTVIVTLTADNCQDRVVSNVMHIYNTLTSNFTYTVPALNQNKFSVEFNTNGVTATSFPVTRYPVTNGSTVTNPANPSNPGYTFNSWHTVAASQGDDNKWVTTTKIYRDTIVYANWTALGATITIKWDTNELNITPAGSNPASASVDSIIAGTDAFTFTLNNAGGTITWTDIIWTFEGSTVSTTASATINGTFVSGHIADFVEGDHLLEVKAKKDGVQFNGAVIISIANP